MDSSSSPSCVVLKYILSEDHLPLVVSYYYRRQQLVSYKVLVHIPPVLIDV